jgi:hypothetical protein
MATAKTAEFYLTETVTLAAASVDGTRVTAAISLAPYLNVPTGQAVQITAVDLIYQFGTDYAGTASQMLVANGSISCQLVDLNPAISFIRADSQSLVASGNVQIDVINNIASYVLDLFPDNFGNDEGAFTVVNDTLYLTGGNDGADIGAGPVYLTARIKMKVVKLGQRDWVALALQSTAEN